ncbi:MAG: hypothetical protein DRO40_04610 [Thermoprotei archaeon]|nr:MAG: hypothetical protein DRO40_04610 [Thermoprotei archaeon]
MVDVIHQFQQDLISVLNEIISRLPNIIGAIIVVLIGYVAGEFIGSAVNKIIQKFVEKPLDRTDVGKTIRELGLDLSDLIGGLTKAFIISISIVAAVDLLAIPGEAGTIITRVANYLPYLIGGITVLTIGVILALGLAKYIGSFLRKAFPEGYASLAVLIENFILLGLIAVVVTISLELLDLQSTLIYPLIVGALVIAIGVFIADSALKIIINQHPEFKELAPFLQFLIILIFLMIGVSAVFSEFPSTIQVINNLALGLAIAFAIVLIPIAFYLAKKALMIAKKGS